MSLGLSWPQAASVVLSTIGIYVALVLLLRIAGQRALAGMSSFDFAAAVALGAVTGRVVLGYTPTLLAGALGLTTLFVLQRLSGLVRRNRRMDELLTNLPLLLVVDGRVLFDNLDASHVVEDELAAMLRQAGLRSYGDAAAVILERTGAISVLRRGETISPGLMRDVRGWHPDLDRHVRD